MSTPPGHAAAPGSERAEIAVIVVSWNTRELLAACLTSLCPEHERGRTEVWVVDNASSDGSAAMVADDFGWVNLIASTENLGYGPAINLAAARTDAAWIAPANADLQFAPDALDQLLAAGERHPGAGAFAPRLVLPNGGTQHSVHPFPTLHRLLVFNVGLQRIVPGLGDRLGVEGYWSPDAERTVDWAHGAFLMIRRAAWTAIGGFDDNQWMYAEDLDIGWRLRRAGFRTVYVPDARVRHEVSAATTKAFGDSRQAMTQRSTYAWMLRRRGTLITRCAAAINLAGALARVAWLLPAARLRPHRYGAALQSSREWARHHRAGLARRADLLNVR